MEGEGGDMDGAAGWYVCGWVGWARGGARGQVGSWAKVWPPAAQAAQASRSSVPRCTSRRHLEPDTMAQWVRMAHDRSRSRMTATGTCEAVNAFGSHLRSGLRWVRER